MYSRRADWGVSGRPFAGWGIRRDPATIVRAEQITGVVERDRLQKNARRSVSGRCRQAGAEHGRRVVRSCRRRHDDPGDVSEDCHGVVVVEMAAEALLVAVSGDPQHHRVLVLPIREERQGRGLAPKLILGVVQVCQVLDLGNRKQAGDAATERDTEDRLFVEKRVEHASDAETALQSTGNAVDASLMTDVLAEHQQLRPGRECIGQRRVDRLGQRQWACFFWKLSSERARPRVRARRPA